MHPKKGKGEVMLICSSCNYTIKTKSSSRLTFKAGDRSKEIVVSEGEERKVEEEKALIEDLYKEMLEYYEE